MKNNVERMSRVGFIGLGRMGAGMAANLRRADVSLVVFDPDSDAVARLTAAGAQAVANPAEVAARVGRLFLCLPFAPEVRAVLFADNGVIHGAQAGLHVIDCTTLIHSDALAIAARDLSPTSATSRAAPAVSAAAMPFNPNLDMAVRHCPSAMVWECTSLRSSRVAPWRPSS